MPTDQLNAQKDSWKETLLSIILTVGGLTLTIFPVIYYFQGRILYAVLEVVCSVLMWLSLIWLKTKHNYYWTSRMGWIGLMLVMTILLFSGGIANTGLIWWSLLPISSFILFGNRGGIKALLLGISILVTVGILSYLGIIEIYFATGQLVQTVVMVTVVSFIVYFYEKISSDAQSEIEEKRLLLESQIKEKQKIEKEMISTMEVLKSEKTKQTKIRSAMLNLLEDGEELEKQLAAEKAGVEKKVVERTLELSNTKAKLDSSIENLPLGFLMIDIGENIVSTNTLAKNILGGENDKAFFSNLKKILSPKLDIADYIKTCNSGKNRVDLNDIEINGRFFRFLLSPIITDDAEQKLKVCIGVVILIQDITEAKILDRSKDEFFSIASHELRTPLTAIRGNTSMILDYYGEALKDAELRSMVDDIHSSSVRLISIVNDFLNVSRLEQGRMVYDLKEVDLTDLIPETIKEYVFPGSEKHISIDFIRPTTPTPSVICDRDKVREVLINLLGNAIKFTQVGGVKISVEPSGKFIKVLVKDTGRGISLVQQNLLFHKFQQAGNSLFTRDTAGGSGLGLYISKMMIEGMGGEVKLESSVEGKGSVFSFTLPIATKENKPDRLSKIGLSGTASPLKPLKK
jgi:signal transduction histidine kinase